MDKVYVGTNQRFTVWQLKDGRWQESKVRGWRRYVAVNPVTGRFRIRFMRSL